MSLSDSVRCDKMNEEESKDIEELQLNKVLEEMPEDLEKMNSNHPDYDAELHLTEPMYDRGHYETAKYGLERILVEKFGELLLNQVDQDKKDPKKLTTGSINIELEVSPFFIHGPEGWAIQLDLYIKNEDND